MSTAAGALQVETSILAEKQALEMPCVAPSLVGRPHRHAYFQSSRVAQAINWGPPQVDTCLLYCLSVLSKVMCAVKNQLIKLYILLSVATCAHCSVCLALDAH